MKHERVVELAGQTLHCNHTAASLINIVIDQSESLEDALQRATEYRKQKPYGGVYWRFWHTVMQVVENEIRSRDGQLMKEIT